MFKKGDVIESSEGHLFYERTKGIVFYVISDSEYSMPLKMYLVNFVPYENRNNYLSKKIRIHSDYDRNYKYNANFIRHKKIKELLK